MIFKLSFDASVLSCDAWRLIGITCTCLLDKGSVLRLTVYQWGPAPLLPLLNRIASLWAGLVQLLKVICSSSSLIASTGANFYQSCAFFSSSVSKFAVYIAKSTSSIEHDCSSVGTVGEVFPQKFYSVIEWEQLISLQRALLRWLSCVTFSLLFIRTT